MLSPLLFSKCLVPKTQIKINIRYCMLAFSLFFVFIYADYDLSMNDKYPIFYVTSSCFFTALQLTDTND